MSCLGVLSLDEVVWLGYLASLMCFYRIAASAVLVGLVDVILWEWSLVCCGFCEVAADTKKPVELVSNTGLFTLMCGYKYVTLNIGR